MNRLADCLFRGGAWLVAGVHCLLTRSPLPSKIELLPYTARVIEAWGERLKRLV